MSQIDVEYLALYPHRSSTAAFAWYDIADEHEQESYDHHRSNDSQKLVQIEIQSTAFRHYVLFVSQLV